MFILYKSFLERLLQPDGKEVKAIMLIGAPVVANRGRKREREKFTTCADDIIGRYITR